MQIDVIGTHTDTHNCLLDACYRCNIMGVRVQLLSWTF